LLFTVTIPDHRALLRASVDDAVVVGAAECLVALKGWERLGRGKPISLAEVCRSAGLTRVAIDSYVGSPLRMTLVSGEPVVYSVGPDGDDDGALKASVFGSNAEGDILFRLPKATRAFRR
jgi:hypothetical protein